MLWLAAVLLAAPAHAEDLTVLVPPDVTEVGLTCGSDRYQKPASEGQREPDGRTALTFPIRPGRTCEIMLVQRVPGSFEQLGTWGCKASGCTKEGSGGPVITAGPGELAVLLTNDIANTQLELTCTDGFRARTQVADHEGRFTGVPTGAECTLTFKGGPPMKFNPIGQGAWKCHLVSGTPVCQAQ